MAPYNSYGRTNWTAGNTFEYVVWASQFTTGTEGEPLRLKIVTSGYRGSYVDNVSLVADVAPNDITPPSPDPMTWEVPPTVGDYGYVTMTATAAYDTADVEYLFTNTVLGTTSGWQDGRTWLEGGLEHGTLYTYQVKARDKSPNQNEGAWSSPTNVTTWSVPEGTLVKFGFQSPSYAADTLLYNSSFEGWTISSTPKVRYNGSNGLPGDDAYPAPNQAIWFENMDDYIQYNLPYTWDASDIYVLTVNAAPQATWNYDKQRYVRPMILEQDGTVLWDAGQNLSGPAKTALPTNINFQASTWQAEPDLNFTFTIAASDFVSVTNAVEGSPIAVKIMSSGAERGVFVDNVMLYRKPPSGTVLMVK